MPLAPLKPLPDRGRVGITNDGEKHRVANPGIVRPLQNNSGAKFRIHF